MSDGVARRNWPADVVPEIVLAGRFLHRDRDFAVAYRQQRNWAVHLYEYRCEMRLDERVFTLQPGDLTLSPAGSVSRYDLPEPGYHLCVHFHSSGSGDELALPLFQRLGPWRDYVVGKLTEVMRFHAAAQPAGDVAAGALLQQTLAWLALFEGPVRDDMTPRAADAVARAAAYIERHLDEPLAVPALAAAVGLSQRYLARLFRQQYGMTMPHYLLQRRMELAHHLLTATDLPVKSIGARVGLADAQHFNKQFRRVMGVSPTAARRGARG